MYAAKDAQKAYVESLYAMNTDQLIAEVMRVQMEAAKLIQQEIENEREACAKVCEALAGDNPVSDYEGGKMDGANDCADAIRARGDKGVQQ
jgi:hypothetical protein